MFRIYAGKDNKPADYSPDNIPYTPKKSLSISIDGSKENDFTMVFGFPGRTTEYLPSAAVEQVMKVNDPAKISIREKALRVLNGFMRNDEEIRIMYAAKYANIENAYKKWQGEVLGLTSTNALEKKRAYESAFEKRLEGNPQLKQQYGSVLQELTDLYKELEPFGYARDYFNEIISKIELFTIAAQLNSLVSAYEKDGERGYQQRLSIVKSTLKDLLGEYNSIVDQQLFETLMEMYVRDQQEKNVSPLLKSSLQKTNNNYTAVASELYSDKAIDKKEVGNLLSRPATDVVAALRTSRVLQLYNDILKTYQTQVQSALNDVQGRINQKQRAYMQAQMDVFKEKTFYPDANSTLRVAFGKVKGYAPRDAVAFDYYTYLDGVMEKYKPGDYEFDLPAKLRELYIRRDYGVYGKNGKMPVCFIATNHTTGGNSGSPVLDAYGNLLGLNFDRGWEGTMSDINYDPSICRNITVDIRYVLFIIDKYAGAGNLIKEMKLVHPKSKSK